jgi:hypothetical protein
MKEPHPVTATRHYENGNLVRVADCNHAQQCKEKPPLFEGASSSPAGAVYHQAGADREQVGFHLLFFSRACS